MEHLAFYHHEDGKKPTVFDYMEELEIFVKEPMKLVHEMLTTMWERGEIEDSRLMHSATTTLWSCMLKWDALDGFFKKEYRGNYPADDFRAETGNAMENRMCHDLEFKFRYNLSDSLKDSMLTSLYGHEELKAVKRLVEVFVKHDEKREQEIESSEEFQEYKEAEMTS